MSGFIGDFLSGLTGGLIGGGGGGGGGIPQPAPGGLASDLLGGAGWRPNLVRYGGIQGAVPQGGLAADLLPAPQAMSWGATPWNRQAPGQQGPGQAGWGQQGVWQPGAAAVPGRTGDLFGLGQGGMGGGPTGGGGQPQAQHPAPAPWNPNWAGGGGGGWGNPHPGQGGNPGWAGGGGGGTGNPHPDQWGNPGLQTGRQENNRAPFGQRPPWMGSGQVQSAPQGNQGPSQFGRPWYVPPQYGR